MIANAYQVYIIQNQAGRFYIGISENVTHRLQQHNCGVARWTRGRGPWQLAWCSERLSLTAARKLENELKRQKGGAGLYERTGLQRRQDS